MAGCQIYFKSVPHYNELFFLLKHTHTHTHTHTHAYTILLYRKILAVSGRNWVINLFDRRIRIDSSRQFELNGNAPSFIIATKLYKSKSSRRRICFVTETQSSTPPNYFTHSFPPFLTLLCFKILVLRHESVLRGFVPHETLIPLTYLLGVVSERKRFLFKHNKTC